MLVSAGEAECIGKNLESIFLNKSVEIVGHLYNNKKPN